MIRADALVLLVTQWLLIGYAVWAVHYRHDRRRIEQNLLQALHGLAACAVVLLALAYGLTALSDGRRFVSVRQISELALVASAASVALAVHLLQGAAHERHRSLNNNRNGDSGR